MEIEGKVAIVTGAVGAIGLAAVQCLLRYNAKYVALAHLRKPDDLLVADSLQTLKKEFDADSFGYYFCNVTSVQEFTKCYEATIAVAGYVDILINNAGIGDDKNIDLIIDVNLKAVIGCTMTALDYMGVSKNGLGGVVVNVASVMGLINSQIAPAYCATKHAVVSFVRSMKEHDKKFGVRIVCVCPHATNTNMMFRDNVKSAVFDFVDITSVTEHSTRPLQNPENVAKAIVEIIENGSEGAVWVSQHDLPAFPVDEDSSLSQLGVEL